MYTHAKKTNKKKNQSITNGVSQKTNHSTQVKQFSACQEIADNYFSQKNQPIQKTENKTGMPDNLKSGIENLSGYSMDDVKVHYNSNKPAQLNAHAYAQGIDIHLAAGQEKHLPHEAWHVVQQKQRRVKPTRQMKGGISVNDDKGLEYEADLMGSKAMQMKSELNQFGIGTASMPVNQTSRKQNPSFLNAGNEAESGTPVQRVEREAQVTWAITHLVKVQGQGPDESLFGGDDWQSNEVSPNELGQLSHDQKIIVDDEAVFMSRRGSNQRTKRQHDSDSGELKHAWLKVLKVWVDGEYKEVPDDSFVRAETIKLAKLPRKEINKAEHEPKDEKTVSSDLTGFHEAWQEAAKKRRRSIGYVNYEFAEQYTEDGDEITSGWSWDQYDEGVDVSGYMKETEERTNDPYNIVKERDVISANYGSKQEQREPIAYMVLEVRDEGSGPYMYLRWLIGHPQKGGGGSELIKEAIERFNKQDKCTELRVDSAYSAVKWYKSKGFKEVYPQKSVVKKNIGYADTELVYRKG